MTLNATVRLGVSATLQEVQNLGSARYLLSYAGVNTLPDGNASGQADLIFADQRTLSGGADEDLDLAAVLIDPLGAALTFAAVKVLAIIASADNADTIVVSPDATNGFDGPLGGTTPTVTIPPGGMYCVTAPGEGWAVAGGTGDLLNVLNSDGVEDAIYDVIVIGASAA